MTFRFFAAVLGLSLVVASRSGESDFPFAVWRPGTGFKRKLEFVFSCQTRNLSREHPEVSNRKDDGE